MYTWRVKLPSDLSGHRAGDVEPVLDVVESDVVFSPLSDFPESVVLPEVLAAGPTFIRRRPVAFSMHERNGPHEVFARHLFAASE